MTRRITTADRTIKSFYIYRSHKGYILLSALPEKDLRFPPFIYSLRTYGKMETFHNAINRRVLLFITKKDVMVSAAAFFNRTDADISGGET